MKRQRTLQVLHGVMICVLCAVPAYADEEPITETVFSAAIQTAESMPRLHSLLISRDGELVVEKYFNGRTASRAANVKSVSKSILSALIGIAIERGDIESIDQPISDYFVDELTTTDASKGAITVGNLLSMQAGLETTSFYNFGAWVLSDDWIGFALRQPKLAEPGTRMLYSSGNTHLLSAILTKASGESTLEFARQYLTGPMGFGLGPWTQDPVGIYFGGNNMELTPRQMMTFGRMFMNDGRIGGRQVVPEEWVTLSTTPRVRSSRDNERQYGYGWWMRDMAGIPTVYAWGFGGQFIMLVDALDLIIVTTSSSEPGSDRRRHTRALYRLLENEIIAPLTRGRTSTSGPT